MMLPLATDAVLFVPPETLTATIVTPKLELLTMVGVRVAPHKSLLEPMVSVTTLVIQRPPGVLVVPPADRVTPVYWIALDAEALRSILTTTPFIVAPVGIVKPKFDASKSPDVTDAAKDMDAKELGLPMFAGFVQCGVLPFTPVPANFGPWLAMIDCHLSSQMNQAYGTETIIEIFMRVAVVTEFKLNWMKSPAFIPVVQTLTAKFSAFCALETVGLSVDAMDEVVGKPAYVERSTSTTHDPVWSNETTQPKTVQPAGIET